MRAAILPLTFASTVLFATAASAQERPLDTAAPPPPAAAEQTEMNSPALLITGTSLAAVGTGTIVAGAVIFAEDSCSDDEDHIGCSMGFGRMIGAFMMGGGGLLALTGAPMIVAGAWQIPSDDGDGPAATATLGLGAGHARLDVTF